MFSTNEKTFISDAVEKAIRELNHPEIPKERLMFHLYVEGDMSCRWANIEPNWRAEMWGADLRGGGE